MNQYQTRRMKSILEKYFNIVITNITDEEVVTKEKKKSIPLSNLIYRLKGKRILPMEKEFLNSLKTEKKTTSASSKRGAISSKVRKEVNERDGKKCQYCSKVTNIELAHIISRGNGGAGTKDNLISLCREHHKTLDNPIGFNAIKKQKKIKEFIITWTK